MENNPGSTAQGGSTPKWVLVLGGLFQLALAGVFASSAVSRFQSLTSLFPLHKETPWNVDNQSSSSPEINNGPSRQHRRLQEMENKKDRVPSYMAEQFVDLEARKKLFRDAPPGEVKYWFEYSGPLQKYYYRYSKSRKKADYFEGRDDSGVVSARFIEDLGGNEEYRKVFLTHDDTVSDDTRELQNRLFENCVALGSKTRPRTAPGTVWNYWFGQSVTQGRDRCRVLFIINSVGAGHGTTSIWDTEPPALLKENPWRWVSEQETAVTHLERNLREINTMCESGLLAARVQMLVCENVAPKWVEWMDAQLIACGGQPWPNEKKFDDSIKVTDRPSPVQVVVASNSKTADLCHDMKSGFMEKRMQDLILAASNTATDSSSVGTKATDPTLLSSDDHDMYIGMKWSSLVTTRSVSSFLQASVDLAAANNAVPTEADESASRPILVPSFVRVSYVSEENSKIAKWRMHGDFFHPAAWEVCKDSFKMTWIPHSLSAANRTLCSHTHTSGEASTGNECGQWWIYFTELQMPTSPEVYADEITSPVVQGGSNSIWMITEHHRLEIVERMVCRASGQGVCAKEPQAVIPLGDLESFLINFTPNTALGRKHVDRRRPGYSSHDEREDDRRRVRERNLLEGQEQIEKALFDYTVYPAALFHKDATVKAARMRDEALGSSKEDSASSSRPKIVKSSYYDITITKPRPPVLGWCQAMARKGLCSLYADYFRFSSDKRCLEACGLQKDFTPVHVEAE